MTYDRAREVIAAVRQGVVPPPPAPGQPRAGLGQASILYSNTPWWLPLVAGAVGGFALAAGAHWAMTNSEKVVSTGAKYAPLLLAENPRRRGRR
jgi:hypothetical protein